MKNLELKRNGLMPLNLQFFAGEGGDGAEGGEGTDINDCYLKISMETRNLRHFLEIKKALIKAGYNVTSEC